MSEAAGPDELDASRLRTGLLLVATLLVAGTTLELVFQHHWTQPVQLVAWAALLLLTAGIVLVWRSGAGAARAVRAIAAIVCLASVVGVVEHVIGNYDAGPLDAVYGEQWDAMAELNRWWVSAIQAVGPSPALAPGVLVLASICLWFAVPSRRDARHM